MTQQLFWDAEIETLTAEHGDAMLVEHGRIVAIGSREQLLRRVGRGDVQQVRLDGAVLLPGFVDGHTHMELSCVAQDHHLAVHAPPVTSVAQLLHAVAQRRRAQPHGLIVARSSFGLAGRLAEGRLPEQGELDRVSPTEPVVVLAGLHVAVLNTAAMRELRLDDDASHERGMTVHRHPDGRPNGVFTEVWQRLPTADEGDVVVAIARHGWRLFGAHGITSLSTIPTSVADVRATQAAHSLGQLPFRVRFYPHVPRVGSLDSVASLGAVSGFGNDMVRFGGVKLFVDGEGGDGLGNSFDDLKWEQRELDELVRAATAARVQLLMHAVTASGIRAALTAVRGQPADALARVGVAHRIEHAGDYVPRAMIGELADAGVGVVTTPHFVHAESGNPDFQPLRALVDAGVRVIAASDATGTVPEGVPPLRNVALMVNRVDERGDPSPHRLTVREAMRAVTTWAAAGQGEGHEKGALRSGSYADFVLLSANPFRLDPQRIAQIRVLGRYLGGHPD